MHGINSIKLINVQQVRIIHHYKTSRNNFTTNAAVWFNKICGFNHLNPEYIHIQVNESDARGTV